MRVDQKVGVLFVFKHKDDNWLNSVKQLCTGALGWEEYEWNAEMDSDGNACPTLLSQLLTIYRFRGLSPTGAIDELVKHPDFPFMKEWLENKDA